MPDSLRQRLSMHIGASTVIRLRACTEIGLTRGQIRLVAIPAEMQQDGAPVPPFWLSDRSPTRRCASAKHDCIVVAIGIVSLHERGRSEHLVHGPVYARLLTGDNTSAAAGLGGDLRREADVQPVDRPSVQARVRPSSETCSSPWLSDKPIRLYGFDNDPFRRPHESRSYGQWPLGYRNDATRNRDLVTNAQEVGDRAGLPRQPPP